jgi:hypothetical protein
MLRMEKSKKVRRQLGSQGDSNQNAVVSNYLKDTYGVSLGITRATNAFYLSLGMLETDASDIDVRLEGIIAIDRLICQAREIHETLIARGIDMPPNPILSGGVLVPIAPVVSGLPAIEKVERVVTDPSNEDDDDEDDDEDDDWKRPVDRLIKGFDFTRKD